MKKRSKHNLGHYTPMTFDMGELVPATCFEVLAGDSIQHSVSTFMRMLPQVAPVMHPTHVSIRTFFVPYRILWEDGDDSWENFITGGEDGLDASVFPQIDFSASPVANGDLANYLGLPIGFDRSCSALPFRAYAKVWNENYRDTQRQTELVIDSSGGADSTTSTVLKHCNWGKDNFTSAKISEQLGTEVTLPLGTSANIYTDAAYDGELTIEDGAGGTPTQMRSNASYLQMHNVTGDSADLLKADLSNAVAPSINSIRENFQIQKFLEWRNLYGGRHEEMLWADFGVRPKDYRIQNPEYLGGGRQTVQFSEVLNQSDAGAGDVGDMYGHGVAAMRSNRYRKFFPEHGLVMVLMECKPIPVYSQAVPKHFLYDDKFDFYNPHLEGLGMQEIQNQEVYFDDSVPTDTFGYEPRYEQYRKIPNRVAGDFAAGQTLENWHMARKFAADVANNSSFITCQPPTRHWAQTATDNLLALVQHNIMARRLIKRKWKPVGLV
jgi:hypothetical protein